MTENDLILTIAAQAVREQRLLAQIEVLQAELHEARQQIAQDESVTSDAT